MPRFTLRRGILRRIFGPHPQEVALRILAEATGPLYGLEIVERSAGKLRRGTVYIHLHRLEDDAGLIESWPDGGSSASGIPRRLYQITDAGRAAIAEAP